MVTTDDKGSGDLRSLLRQRQPSTAGNRPTLGGQPLFTQGQQPLIPADARDSFSGTACMLPTVLSALCRFMTEAVMNLHKALSTIEAMRAVPDKEH